jgi:hypothetical protein
MIDIVCSETPSRGSRVHAGVSMRAGGSAVNAANYAAAAGTEACVVGRIGDDPAGTGAWAAVDLATPGLAAADSFLRPPSSLAPPRESPNWPPSRFLACGVLGWEFVQP